LRQRTPNRNDRRYTYEQETYLEHITGLYRAYREKWWDNDAKVWRQPLQADMAYAFKTAEQRLQLPAGTLDNTIRLAIAGHDLGKLGEGWQRWVHRWQELIEKPVADEMMLAHTDYDGSLEHDKLQKKLKKEIGPRPPHAAESAYGLLPGLVGLTSKNPHLVRATTTTITCHHSATHQGGVQTFQIHPQGRPALQEALDLVGLSNLSLDAIRWSLAANDSVGPYMVEPDKMAKQMLPYFLLVRVLRLADQRSQQ
jgi:CRISPR-associated endonuclease/helicase Cas3